MAGTVITLSPRISLRDAERLARARLERDGGAVFAASSSDARQLRQLGRLRGRLAADDGLLVFFNLGEVDGIARLTVTRPGQERAMASWGEAKVG